MAWLSAFFRALDLMGYVQLGMFVFALALLSITGWTAYHDRTSVDWPSVAGRITANEEIDTEDVDDEGATTHASHIEIQYAYEVGQRHYTGERVAFHFLVPDARTHEWGKRYPVGTTVRVFHDASHPKLAVLEPGSTGVPWLPLLWALAVLFATAIFGTPKAYHHAQKRHPSPPKKRRLWSLRWPFGQTRPLTHHIDDMQPRAALAKRLEERGDPRGEYVRQALLLDELMPWDDDFVEVRRRVQFLEARHGLAWSRPAWEACRQAAGDHRWERTSFSFRRGALERLEGDLDTIARQMKKLLGTAPICDVSERSITGRGTIAQLRDGGMLRRVRRLSWSPSAASIREDFDLLLESPNLDKLTHLSISSQDAPHGAPWSLWLPEMVACPALASLTHLELGPSNPVTGQTLVAFSESQLFQGLVHLSLLCNETSNALHRVSTARDLRSLHLAGADIADLTRLTEGVDLPKLERLALSPTERQDLHAFCIVVPSLRSLALQGFQLSDGMVAKLLDDSQLPRVCVLELTRSLASAKAIERLAKHGGRTFGRVTSLDVSSNPVSGKTLRKLLRSELTNHLHTLAMRDATLDDSDAKALASWSGLAELHTLDLSGNELGLAALTSVLRRARQIEDLRLDEVGSDAAAAVERADGCAPTRLAMSTPSARALERVVDSGAFDQLERLALRGGHLAAGSVATILRTPNLGRIHLQNVAVDDEVRDALQARLGPFVTEGGRPHN